MAEFAMNVKEIFQQFKAFVTGSHAYGTPGLLSDIDLVVLMDPETLEKLQVLTDKTGDTSEYGAEDIGCLYFGNLNIIPVCNQSLFEVWRLATEFLKTKAPVSREEAIKYMNKKRRAWMLKKDGANNAV